MWWVFFCSFGLVWFFLPFFFVLGALGAWGVVVCVWFMLWRSGVLAVELHEEQEEGFAGLLIDTVFTCRNQNSRIR